MFTWFCFLKTSVKCWNKKSMILTKQPQFFFCSSPDKLCHHCAFFTLTGSRWGLGTKNVNNSGLRSRKVVINCTCVFSTIWLANAWKSDKIIVNNQICKGGIGENVAIFIPRDSISHIPWNRANEIEEGICWNLHNLCAHSSWKSDV